MLLAIDAGNTNVVFAIIRDEEIIAEWRAATTANRTADEYWVWLFQLMAHRGLNPGDVKGTIIATVVPQALFNLRQLCVNYFKNEPMVVGDPRLDLGLRINLRRPDVVGADRLANAVAAHETYGGPLIVVDFGTATNFDVVSPKGDYEGGVIAPGVNLSLEALHQAAAKLPRIAVEQPQAVIGTDTVPAMQSGIFWGYVGLVEGLVARIQREYDCVMKVIATGGLARLFRNSTPAIDVLDVDLTIRGLLEIHKRNAATWATKPEGQGANG